MTTPIQRLTRLLNEGARFMVELPGQMSIDLTPDVIAALNALEGTSGAIKHDECLSSVDGTSRCQKEKISHEGDY
jgi:hypothetical protein